MCETSAYLLTTISVFEGSGGERGGYRKKERIIIADISPPPQKKKSIMGDPELLVLFADTKFSFAVWNKRKGERKNWSDDGNLQGGGSYQEAAQLLQPPSRAVEG